MKKLFLSLLVSTSLIACTPTTQNTPQDFTCHPIVDTPVAATATNQTTLTTGCGYFNQPCVTVTVCIPGGVVGTSDCQVIPDVLLDTGSVGLRLFSCAVTLPLNNVGSSLGHDLADFVGFLDGSCQWGPVKSADIYIGSGDVASSVPIQIIDAKYGTVPASQYTNNFSCPQPDYSAAASGYNGILGVGLSVTDCYANDPSGCDVPNTFNGSYFDCDGTSCTSIAAAQAKQVTNPVTKIAIDNNGVILSYPTMTTVTGAPSLNGTLTLGIGTHAAGGGFVDNSLGAATVYKADGGNQFKTDNFPGFDGQVYPGSTAFIDSGSNTLAFPTHSTPDTNAPFTASLPLCAGSNFYCPQSFVAINGITQTGVGAGATTSAGINVRVDNALTLLSPSNPNLVFFNVSSNLDQPTFDWGFPFFIGRTVFVHISGQTAAGGTISPFWAW